METGTVSNTEIACLASVSRGQLSQFFEEPISSGVGKVKKKTKDNFWVIKQVKSINDLQQVPCVTIILLQKVDWLTSTVYIFQSWVEDILGSSNMPKHHTIVNHLSHNQYHIKTEYTCITILLY